MNLSKNYWKKLFSRVQWFENIRTCFLWFFILRAWVYQTSLVVRKKAASITNWSIQKQLISNWIMNPALFLPLHGLINLAGRKFSVFNSGNNRLYLYDAETRKLKAKLSFEAEGPDGIGSSRIIGYQYISSDSIFIFTYNLMKLFHVDTSGKIHRYYPVRGETIM